MGGTPIFLRILAMAASAPYLSLKIAWLAGSDIGIPEGSVLLSGDVLITVANAVTVLMDACIAVLALLLTRPWGRRVPAWLLALPMWGAVGLLTPIMFGFPAGLVAQALGGEAADPASPDRPFLEPWVFDVVYTGFILQGLALGTLFVLYARERWGHLWQGRLGELTARPPGRGPRLAVAAAALLALWPAVTHALWLSGFRSGLATTLADTYDANSAASDTGFVLYAAATVAGAALLLRPGGSRLALRVPLLLAGVGSAALAGWGGWLLMATLSGPRDGGKAATWLMTVTYSVQMIIGLLVLAAGARFFTRRAIPARAS
ncbi:hypothetical protein [Streptomyces sp. NPDC053048]|uniref:hypothetical protein n=1 Tax=Streptomyces sp. NPDC053048 TaxID=3365694 RepID=UPI0037CF9300